MYHILIDMLLYMNYVWFSENNKITRDKRYESLQRLIGGIKKSKVRMELGKFSKLSLT
jgi:hypothetical protein